MSDTELMAKEYAEAQDEAAFQDWLQYNQSELDKEFLSNYKEELNEFYKEAWKDARCLCFP